VRAYAKGDGGGKRRRGRRNVEPEQRRGRVRLKGLLQRLASACLVALAQADTCGAMEADRSSVVRRKQGCT
jgi:hypothetical protein